MENNMFLKILPFIVLTITVTMAKPISDDDSEVTLSIVNADETRAKRQAGIFDFIHQAIEKYEKEANFKPHESFMYQNIHQQAILEDTNSHLLKNTGNFRVLKTNPLLSANYKILLILACDQNSFGTSSQYLCPHMLHQNEFPSMDSPGCKCYKGYNKNPFNRNINKNETENSLEKKKSGELSTTTTESSFQLQTIKQNAFLSDNTKEISKALGILTESTTMPFTSTKAIDQIKSHNLFRDLKAETVSDASLQYLNKSLNKTCDCLKRKQNLIDFKSSKIFNSTSLATIQNKEKQTTNIFSNSSKLPNELLKVENSNSTKAYKKALKGYSLNRNEQTLTAATPTQDLSHKTTEMPKVITTSPSKGTQTELERKEENSTIATNTSMFIIKETTSSIKSKAINSNHSSLAPVLVQNFTSNHQLKSNHDQLHSSIRDSLENPSVTIKFSNNGKFKSINMDKQSSELANNNKKMDI